jgi:hypothetical protein
LSKLLVSYKGSGCDQAEVSRLCVNLILLCSSVMRLTNVDGSKGMDSDSLEKLCSIMSVARCHVTHVSQCDYVFRAQIADNSSDDFLQRWIATSVKLYSDVVQVRSCHRRSYPAHTMHVSPQPPPLLLFPALLLMLLPCYRCP